MKRMMNIRYLFFAAVALGLGIFLGSYFYRYGYFYLLVAAEIAVPVFLAVFLAGSRRVQARCCRKGAKAFCRISNKIRFSLLVALLAFGTGVLLFFGGGTSFESSAIPGARGSVTGRAVRVRAEGGAVEIWLENAWLDTLGTEVGLPGKVSLKVKGSDLSETGLAVGDLVQAEADIFSNPLFRSGEVNGYAYRYNLRYSASAEAEAVTVTAGAMKPMERMREGLRQVLNRHMAPELHGIAFGMLTGDTSYMPDTILENYRTAGLAHIFAVSGLHVGFLAAVLDFLFKKLFRLHPAARFALTCTVIGFYSFFAGLSGSILRAGIMVLVLYAARTFGSRHDSLSALSLSFLAILCVRPLLLFETGFLMSYSVMLAIFFLSAPINRLFLRKASSRVGQSVAASLGILPVSIAYFHTVSLFSVFLNILLLPILSAVFVMLLPLSSVAALVPSLGALLKVAESVLFLSVFACGAAAAIPYAEIVLYSLSGFAALYYLALFLFSRYFLAGKAVKRIAGCAVLGIFILSVSIWAYVPWPARRDSITVFGSAAEQNALVTFSDGARIFINSSPGYHCGRSGEEYLKENRVRKLSAVIVTSLSSSYLDTLAILSRSASFSTVYLPFSADFPHTVSYEIIRQNGLKIVFLRNGETYRVEGSEFSVLCDSEAYALSFGDILYCSGLNGARLESLKKSVTGKVSIIKSETDAEEFRRYFAPQYLLSHRNIPYAEDNCISAERYGAATAIFRRAKGKYILT